MTPSKRIVLFFFFLFFFKQKTAYEIHQWLEFRRVLFRSGMTLADLLRFRSLQANQGQPSPKTSVIFIELDGGPSQFETYDPKPEAPLEYRGPFQTIATNVPGVFFSELMVEQARVMDKMAIVR